MSTPVHLQSGGLSLRTATIVLIIALLATAAPLAAASHWSLYREAGDNHVATTLEDDGGMIRASGNPLDGRVNRVVAPGGSPGDGSLFLDARMATRIGSGTADIGFDVHSSLAADVAGRSDLLLPGEQHLAAWYGQWNDFSNDGIIDDLHDGACDGAPCPEDEFIWRGVGSGVHGATVTGYIVPVPSGGAAILSTNDFLRPPYVAAYTNGSRITPVELDDGTGRTNAEQGWTGAFSYTADGGFLTEISSLVLANAPPVTGGTIGYAIDDPAALYDVDNYEAVSPEVGALFLSTVATLRGIDDTWVPTYGLVRDTYTPTYFMALQTALATVASAQALAAEVLDAVSTPDAASSVLFSPRDSKEPNTAMDDSGGRALWGGGPGVDGAGNSYTGYDDGYHLYMDVIARTSVCAGAYAEVPGTSIAEDHTVTCQTRNVKPYAMSPYEFDPAARYGSDVRSSSVSLQFAAHIVLWRDLNGDTHLGKVCDPGDAESFDHARNTCRDAPRPWPHRTASTEQLYVCPSTEAKGTTFTVTPLGDWDRAYLVKDVATTTRLAYDTENVKPLVGSEPVTIRWEDDCRGPTAVEDLLARDAIVFANGGSTVPLLVDVTVTLLEFVDATAGIRVVDEYVRDVDVIPPAL